MLNPRVIILIEQKFGRSIRYPQDCDHLASEMRNSSNLSISGSTLKRLFGFYQETESPRLYTLDMIARYLGYKNYDELWLAIDTDSSSFDGAEVFSAQDMPAGTALHLKYCPDRDIKLLHEGDSIFQVTAAVNSKLKAGDKVWVSHFVKNHPFVCRQVWRNDANLGNYLGGRREGITYLRIIQPDASDEPL